MASPSVRIVRSVKFSAAHRYVSAQLSDAENQRVFGACYRPHGHGHNYRLDVGVEGAVDPITGMVMNLADLDRVLKREVVAPFDHSFLNYDIEHFAETVPTCENLALYFARVLPPHIEAATEGRMASVRVWESDDLFAEVEL